MSDRSTAVPAPPSATAEYARIYEEQQPRLVAYARSLTRNAWTAEDLVAEAHFRVWRRLAEGHAIDNVPAYLRTTVRHLAIASGTAVRETPRDPQAEERAGTGSHGADPAERVASVDLLVRVLGELPERWVKALWLAEAEGQPLAAIGPQLGTKDGATAVLLHRAREGMRQAFLRTQSGAPDDPTCQVHWARMPAYVRDAATARQRERLLGHVDTCDDCRQRLAALMLANDRLPALVGPGLLVFALGATGKYLLGIAAGAAGAAGAAVGGAPGVGLLHGIRHAAIGGSKAPAAVAAGALVAGAAAVCLVLVTPGTAPAPPDRAPVADVPVTQVPVAPVDEAPVAPPSKTPVAARGPESVVLPAAAPQSDDGEAERPRTDGAGTTPETPATSAPTPQDGGGTDTPPPAEEPADGTPPPDDGTPEEEQPVPPDDEGTPEPESPPATDPEPAPEEPDCPPRQEDPGPGRGHGQGNGHERGHGNGHGNGHGKGHGNGNGKGDGPGHGSRR